MIVRPYFMEFTKHVSNFQPTNIISLGRRNRINLSLGHRSHRIWEFRAEEAAKDSVSRSIFHRAQCVSRGRRARRARARGEHGGVAMGGTQKGWVTMEDLVET